MSPAQAGRVVTVCTRPRGDRAKLAPVRPGVDRRPRVPEWTGPTHPGVDRPRRLQAERRAQRSCSVSAARRSPGEKEAPR